MFDIIYEFFNILFFEFIFKKWIIFDFVNFIIFIVIDWIENFDFILKGLMLFWIKFIQCLFFLFGLYLLENNIDFGPCLMCDLCLMIGQLMTIFYPILNLVLANASLTILTINFCWFNHKYDWTIFLDIVLEKWTFHLISKRKLICW